MKYGRLKKIASDHKISKPATFERLRAGGLFYLDKYSSSSDNLRRLLMRRVYKSAILHETDPVEGAEFVDNIIAKFMKSGILDDAEYARMKIESLSRRGASHKMIKQKLMTKGVDLDIINKILDQFIDDTGKREIDAAIAYIKRRKLGAYRLKDRDKFKEKDMAALSRQGFSYDIAKKMINIDDEYDFDQIDDIF